MIDCCKPLNPLVILLIFLISVASMIFCFKLYLALCLVIGIGLLVSAVVSAFRNGGQGPAGR